MKQVDGSGREELEMASPFLCCPLNRECHVKENPDRVKIEFSRVGILFI